MYIQTSLVLYTSVSIFAVVTCCYSRYCVSLLTKYPQTSHYPLIHVHHPYVYSAAGNAYSFTVALSEAILSLTSLSQSMSEVMHNGAAASHMAPSENGESEPHSFLYDLL